MGSLVICICEFADIILDKWLNLDIIVVVDDLLGLLFERRVGLETGFVGFIGMGYSFVLGCALH